MSATFIAPQKAQHPQKCDVQDIQNDRYLNITQVLSALAKGSEMPC